MLFLSSVYQQALANLENDARQTVQNVFATWSRSTDYCCRIHENVSNETALSILDFTSLLSEFATQIANGKLPLDAWQMACRTHKLKGCIIPDIECPSVLGRAKGLEHHAIDIAKSSNYLLTQEKARKLLLKYSGLVNLDGFEIFLREALLGNYLVWATFNPINSKTDPFDLLPRTHHGIRTALGLGKCEPTEILIVLVWNHVDSGSPPLHRPTVADAEDYPYYRPRLEVDARWGLTEPLSPNPNKLEPQPEVVMPETTGKGLRLPFHVVRA